MSRWEFTKTEFHPIDGTPIKRRWVAELWEFTDECGECGRADRGRLIRSLDFENDQDWRLFRLSVVTGEEREVLKAIWEAS